MICYLFIQYPLFKIHYLLLIFSITVLTLLTICHFMNYFSYPMTYSYLFLLQTFPDLHLNSHIFSILFIFVVHFHMPLNSNYHLNLMSFYTYSQMLIQSFQAPVIITTTYSIFYSIQFLLYIYFYYYWRFKINSTFTIIFFIQLILQSNIWNKFNKIYQKNFEQQILSIKMRSMVAKYLDSFINLKMKIKNEIINQNDDFQIYYINSFGLKMANKRLEKNKIIYSKKQCYFIKTFCIQFIFIYNILVSMLLIGRIYNSLN